MLLVFGLGQTTAEHMAEMTSSTSSSNVHEFNTNQPLHHVVPKVLGWKENKD